jgi:molecular chaperone GrpE
MSDDKKPAQEPPVNEAANQPGAAGTPPPIEGLESLIGPEQLRAMITALQAELDKKTEEAGQKHDAYLRAVAETENVRRRMEKEKEETARYAISKFAKDILSVGDNFQRAIAAVPPEAVAADPALKTLVEGVTLAERDFRSALERHGVRTIEPAGQPFNPHQHQAVMEKEDASVPAGTVLQVFQTGYLIDDRCLRPAMVVVSRGGPKAAPKPADGNGNGEPPRA